MSKLKVIFLCTILTASYSSIYSQFPDLIKISRGRCATTCGFSYGFHDVYFINELEYNLSDSTFRFRKKPNKKFIFSDEKPTQLFTDSNTYIQLDSLFDILTKLPPQRGKYFIYRIELIYESEFEDIGLPRKIKTLELFITTNPKRTYPEILDDFLWEYNRVFYASKKSKKR
jgi:hypothetical protein